MFRALTASLACSVCFGDPSSSQSKAAIMGIFVMLGVVVFVLGFIAFTAFTWARRAKSIDSSSR